MTADRELQRQAYELFLEALERSSEEREAFIAERTAGNPELLGELRSLLAHHEQASEFLATPALSVGAGHPKEVGPYRIVELLGEGGMGTVYLAEQQEPVTRRVALKVIKLGMDTRRVHSRFQHERQALALMNHPGIASIFDAGTSERGQAYFAMEYVEGLPITEYCEENALDLKARLQLFLSVCRAVQHAHQKGILHRDLKPSNVLVSTVDGQPRPLVIDFGVACAIHMGPGERITATDGIGRIGTPDYMSPEQAGVGNLDVDGRSDVYSLGVLLFEMVTGALPYRFDSGSGLALVAVQQRLMKATPPLPSRQGRAVPRELDWIILKAMAVDREERYDTPSKLADDLQRFLHNDPVKARAPSRIYLARKFVRRNALLVSIAGMLLAILVVIAGLFMGLWMTTSNELLKNKIATRSLLDQVRPMNVEQQLQALREEQEKLWPVRREMLPRMERWLAEGEALIGELKHLQSGPADLQADDPEIQAIVALSRSRRERLLGELRTFRDGESEFGTLPEMRKRLALTKLLEHESLVNAAEAWKHAIDAIADSAQHPAYNGLRIEPQAGLIPLGPDPDSGLWEFLFVGSGKTPQRTANGRIRADGEMGVVLVLLPGGTAQIGIERGEWPGAPALESPRHEVQLDPFFLAKYELSEGQRFRLECLTAPAECKPTMDVENPELAGSYISWNAGTLLLKRVGLELPSEAQWEYAARGNTLTTWFTGDDPLALLAASNSYNEQDTNGQPEITDRWAPEFWSRGPDRLAPIGRLAPNPFGLHDIAGNVYEYCQDLVSEYGRVEYVPGTGLAIGSTDFTPGHALRGGSYFTRAAAARSSHRYSILDPDQKERGVGLRPARGLERLKR